MEKRPLSLTIIGWLIIVSAILGVLASYVAMTDIRNTYIYSSVSLHYKVYIVANICLIICGIGLLRGRFWAIILYVLNRVFIFLYIVSVAGFMPKRLIMLVILAVVLYFLNRPHVKAYFVSRSQKRKS